MAKNKVWCLLLDHDHMSTFGEPFPVTIDNDDTIHQVKTMIKVWWIKLPDVTPNHIEIWKCKTSKLSANDSFSLTKRKIGNFKFDDDENSDVEHLGAARRVMEIGLEDCELLLALIPRTGTRCLFLCSVFLTKLPMYHIA